LFDGCLPRLRAEERQTTIGIRVTSKPSIGLKNLNQPARLWIR
jgi:hypothetical protein